MSLLKCYTALLLCVGLVAGEIGNKGWWRNTVFYQIYPRSFMDFDNNGIGDLKGITSKLQHFKDSGIGAIWLSPIYKSPMVDFGYDISNFTAIAEEYGTMEDLEELTKKAKELGIKVIMDLVPNHTSDKHEWFQKSVKGEGDYKDYYIWRKGKNDNKSPPNNWISVFSGPAWTLDTTRNEWYFHQFDYRQPDLDYTNEKVKKEMEDVIKFWLGKGIDGFRIDAIPHVYERDDLIDEPLSNTPGADPEDYTYLNHIYTKDDPRTYELIASWRKVVDDWADQKNEDEKVLMTEAYTNLSNTTKYYKYGSNVPFNFNFIMNVNKDSKAVDFKKVIDDWMENTPQNESANWVMGNHDRSRTATRYPGRADQMTMLAMVLPGIAVTYNGEEIGMEDKLDISWSDTQDPQACNTNPDRYTSRSRDPNRTPFQWDDSKNAGFSTADKCWLPVHENYKELNLKKQKVEPGSHYDIYQKLTSMRNNLDTMKQGGLKTDVLNDGKVLAVVRENDNNKTQSVIMLINFSNDQSQVVDITNYNLDKSFHVYVSSVNSNIKNDQKFDSNNITLPAKVAIILQPNGAFVAAPRKIVLVLCLMVLRKLFQ